MPAEQQLLRSMSKHDRDQWLLDNLKQIRVTGTLVIKIDGVCVAAGYDDEIMDVMERFHKAIDGPDLEPKTGGMG